MNKRRIGTRAARQAVRSEEGRIADLLRGIPHPDFVKRFESDLMKLAALRAPEGLVLHDKIRAARIGLIADTHCRLDDGGDLPSQVLQAFQGVDLIIHCGDLGKLGVLDRLQSVAPVLAVRSPNDPHEDGSRLAEVRRVIEIGGLRIGVTFGVSDLGIEIDANYNLRTPSAPLEEVLAGKFGGRVDILAFATIHKDLIAYHRGLLIINPGSPTLPVIHREGELGTVALLNSQEGQAAVEIVHLRR
jgi:putative phosphoesterase